MIRALLATAVMLAATPLAAQETWETVPAPAPMPDPAETGMAPVNGIEMYYAAYGADEGIPILLIHGGLAHGDIWGDVVASLMSDHRVIVADTRGHGRSTNDGSAYSYDLLAQDYLALMDYLELDQVHLVGWSDGANIGYAISQEAPLRLASHFAHAGNVTLDGIDPAVDGDPVFGSYIEMMAEDYAGMSPTPEGFEAFLGAIVEMWSSEKPDAWEALETVPVRTLVVQSEHDEAILAEHAERIAETIPGADYLLLDDVSHFAAFQNPGTYAAEIRSFAD
ncbi:alpha/beta fold hydrolase [Rhodobacterales bacterium HKCCE2091]|nr:alpha/beta fold hydrolase [Rhodobacterales bacterium HKCCE2091]